MAESIRELIVQDVETALKTISIANGYNNNIGLVTRTSVIDVSQSNIPILYIQQGNEDVGIAGEDAQTNFNQVSRNLEVRVIIIHRHDPAVDGKSVDAVLNSIQQDVYKAMMIDPQRSNHAIDTLPGRVINQLELETNFEGAQKLIKFNVKYRHHWQDESVPA